MSVRQRLAALAPLFFAQLRELRASAEGLQADMTTALDKDTFDAYVDAQIEKKRHALIMFHVNWCGVCKRTLPKFINSSSLIAEEGLPLDLAHVDCTSDKTLCHQHNVGGYPTIKLFEPRKFDRPLDFKGQRSEEGFLNYTKRMTAPAVSFVANAAELEAAMVDETFAAVVVQAPSLDEVPRGVTALAQQWRDRHRFLAAASLSAMMPDGVKVPSGAKLAVLSLARQQMPIGQGKQKAEALFMNGDLTSERQLKAWLPKNRFPGVWVLDDSSFFEFTHAGSRTALVALDMDATVMAGKSADVIKSMIAAEQQAWSREYLFGVVNATEWAGELADFNIHTNDLPRVLVAERDFDAWYEDMEVMTLDTFGTCLGEIADGSTKMLRQDRTFWSRVYFYQREGGRFLEWFYAYSLKGPKELAIAGTLVAAVSLAVAVIGWGLISCCRYLMQDDEDADQAKVLVEKAKAISKKDD